MVLFLYYVQPLHLQNTTSPSMNSRIHAFVMLRFLMINKSRARNLQLC